MKGVVDAGTAGRIRYGYGLSIDLAGKTGTSQNHSDGWMIAFTPNLVVGSWVGGESPLVRFRSSAYGLSSSTALPIVGGFLKKMMADPNLKTYQYRKFDEVPDSILAKLDCVLLFLVAQNLGTPCIFQSSR